MQLRIFEKILRPLLLSLSTSSGEPCFNLSYEKDVAKIAAYCHPHFFQ